jgi:hypothetical protein
LAGLFLCLKGRKEMIKSMLKLVILGALCLPAILLWNRTYAPRPGQTDRVYEAKEALIGAASVVGVQLPRHIPLELPEPPSELKPVEISPRHRLPEPDPQVGRNFTDSYRHVLRAQELLREE